MSRSVQIVLLCEDRQHETFVRRFLNKTGQQIRDIRVSIAPPGRGAAEQFVRKQFPIELSTYRANRKRVTEAVVVMIDGDSEGATARMNRLNQACRARGVEPRRPDERVAVFIPTWNIETWLAYLGGSHVDEKLANYPRLNRPRDCQTHVNELHQMCQQRELRRPSPPSLVAACEEYRLRLQ